MSWICEIEHSYCHIDMSNKFSIIIPLKKICATPQTFWIDENFPIEVKFCGKTLDIHKN